MGAKKIIFFILGYLLVGFLMVVAVGDLWSGVVCDLPTLYNDKGEVLYHAPCFHPVRIFDPDFWFEVTAWPLLVIHNFF